ncbi:MAG: FtsX-like permease family protein [Lachnospirales bacterium]
MIFKIIRRSLLKKRTLFITICFLFIIFSTMFSARELTFGTIKENFKELTKNANVEDFRLYGSYKYDDYYTEDFINNIEESYDITIERENYIKIISDNIYYSVYETENDNKINIPVLNEGDFAVNAGEINVLPGFLKEKDLKLGDELSVNDKSYKIVGTVFPQDQIEPIEYTDTNISSKDYNIFAPIYMNKIDFKSLYEEHFDESIVFFKGIYNERLGRNKDSIDSTRKLYFEDILDDSEDNFDVDTEMNMEYVSDKDFYTYTDTMVDEIIAKSYIDKSPLFVDYVPAYSNSSIIGATDLANSQYTLFSIFVFILLAMTLIMICVLTTTSFKSCRKDIGILKAEGVKKREISRKVLLFYTVVYFVATVVGFILSILISKFFLSFFINSYEGPFGFSMFSSISATFKLFIYFLILILFIVYISFNKIFSKRPINLIKNIDKETLPKHSYGKGFSKLKFTTQYQISILLRNYKRSLLLVLGIMISGTLFIFSTVFIDQIIQMATGVFDGDLTYKYKVTSVINEYLPSEDTSIEALTKIKSINGKEVNDVEFLVTGLNYNNPYMNVYNINGEKVSTTDGIGITDDFAKTYEIGLGDKITFYNPFVSDDTVDVEVTEIVKGTVVPTLYMSTSFMQEKFGLESDFANTKYFDEELTPGVQNKILEKDPNAKISKLTPLSDELKSGAGSVYAQIGMIIFFAILIAFFTLFSITNIVVDSNRKTISIMKVLGYRDKEIKKMTIDAYKWVALVTFLILVPIIKMLLFQSEGVGQDGGQVTLPSRLNPLLIGISFIVMATIYYVSAKLSYNSVKDINPAESLKIED